ncbi:beta-defensin 110-like [Cynocephalus volans]|uniref:beta-defensin 110-like n=1 Tax=Cynocephalus volans TaxID=110931 RepID=UPI002FCCAA44
MTEEETDMLQEEGTSVTKSFQHIFQGLCVLRSHFPPKYRLERCQKVKGICKTFCDHVEYDYGYCIKWRNQCCI